MRGAADYSGDGRVTLDEAYSFAHEETLSRTERTQYGPQHAARDTQLSGTGDLVFTDLGLTSATLVLDGDLAGQALVRDSDGRLVAELEKPFGREIQLGLTAGTYDLTLVQQDARYALASIDVDNGTSSLLSASDLVWYEAESTVARGDVPIDAPVALLVGPSNPNWTRPVHLSLLALGSDPPVTDNLAISLVGGVADAVDGAALALGYFHVTGRASGFPGALGGTTAREIEGAQIAIGFGGHIPIRKAWVDIDAGWAPSRPNPRASCGCAAPSAGRS